MNLTKTKYIVFGNRKIECQTSIKIDDTHIERVQVNKFLGIIVDEKLCWKQHINVLTSKLAKNIGIIGKLRSVLDCISLRLLYNSLVLPYLTYGAELWGNNYRTNIEKNFLLQKKAIRIVYHSDFYAPTNPIFAASKILKLYDIVNLNTLIVMFMAYNNKLPQKIQNIFEHRESHYSLRGKQMFRTNIARTNKKSYCVSVKGVTLWNKLSDNIKTANALKSFKILYKCSVLEKYQFQE